MNDIEAVAALKEVERVRHSTRRMLEASWLPMLVFGLLTLGSSAFTGIGEGEGVGVYWLVAGPIGLAVTWRFYRERELRLGLVDRNEYYLAAIVAAMVGTAVVVGWAGEGGTLSAVGPLYAIAGGLIAIALLFRGGVVALAGVEMAALATVLVLVEPGNVDTWAALGQGAILVKAGTIAFRHSRGSEASTGGRVSPEVS